MSVSIETIQNDILQPYQKHRQLSIKESEHILLDLISLLCDTNLKDKETLKYLAKLITTDTYLSIIDERNMNKVCGYPLCNKSPERVRDMFSMDEATRRFMIEDNPYWYLSRFCSKLHYRCSQFYQLQLSNDALFSRIGIHLIDDTIVENSMENDKKYKLTLLEDLLVQKATEDDIKSVISDLKKLDIKETKQDTEAISADSLSKWLDEIKIEENSNPSIHGDF